MEPSFAVLAINAEEREGEGERERALHKFACMYSLDIDIV